MGFGILFIGYILFLYPLNFYLLTPACLVMFFGLRKLSLYNSGFCAAYRMDSILFFGGLFPIALGLAEAYHKMPGALSPDICRMVISILLRLLLALFYLALFSGIIRIAEETGLPKLRLAALRNRIFSVAYCLLCAVLELDFGEGFAKVISRALLPVFLVGIVITVLNLCLFYSCYMRITLSGSGTGESLSLSRDDLSGKK